MRRKRSGKPWARSQASMPSPVLLPLQDASGDVRWLLGGLVGTAVAAKAAAAE